MTKSQSLQPNLFLGYPVTGKYAAVFSSTDEGIKSLIIQPGEMYLQQIEHNQTQYLGKFLGEKCSVKEISLLEANIYSLLQRLTPDFSVKSSSLSVFPVFSK